MDILSSTKLFFSDSYKTLSKSKLCKLCVLMFCMQAFIGTAFADGQKFHRLSATQLRTLLEHHQVTDDAHWADIFLPDGQLGGHQLGNPQTGSWKVTKQDELCVVRKAKHTESDCFSVWLKNDQVQYKQGSIVLTEGILKPND